MKDLLVWVRRMQDLSNLMHWLQGVAAQDAKMRSYVPNLRFRWLNTPGVG